MLLVAVVATSSLAAAATAIVNNASIVFGPADCIHRNRKLRTLERSLVRLPSVAPFLLTSGDTNSGKTTFYTLLLILARVRFGLVEFGTSTVRTSVSTAGWPAFLAEVEQELPTIEASCAPAAALLTLLLAEVVLHNPVEKHIPSCSTVLSAVNNSRWLRAVRTLRRSYPQRRQAAHAAAIAAAETTASRAPTVLATWWAFDKVFYIGAAMAAHSMTVAHRWSRRCATFVKHGGEALAASEQVLWSCFRPLSGTRDEVDEELREEEGGERDPVLRTALWRRPAMHGVSSAGATAARLTTSGSARQGQRKIVCVTGASRLALSSPNSFWHFVRGYFFEVLVSLGSRLGSEAWGLGGSSRSVVVALGDVTFVCDARHTWSNFFIAFLGVPPLVDPQCRLTRLRGDLVIGLRVGVGHEIMADACAWRPALRSVAAARLMGPGASEAQSLVLLGRRAVTTLSVAREPINSVAVRVAAARLCEHLRLACVLDMRLEDMSWRQQILTALGTRVLVGYHGSGLGAASLWLPSTGAIVVEFSPPGCWWCTFACGVARPNCTAQGESGHITWLLSTTAETPLARLPDGGNDPASPHVGCVSGLSFNARRELPRRVGLRILGLRGAVAAAFGASQWARDNGAGSAAAAAARGITRRFNATDVLGDRDGLRRWAHAESHHGSPPVYLEACGGSAVQVYES